MVMWETASFDNNEQETCRESSLARSFFARRLSLNAKNCVRSKKLYKRDLAC